MIKFANVTKFYRPNTYALRNVSFHIKPGEFVSIVGQSGAGKSTIIKLLTAEEKADEGKIIIGGWDITKVRPAEIPTLRRQLGVVFQDFKLLSKKTVYENIAFALEVINTPYKNIKPIVKQVLKIVGLENKINYFPRQLSSGEAQRVVIARSLVHRPKILLADEPTGNLDPITTRDIIELLTKINEFGTTILLVTHNREIVNFFKKRVITLDRGVVIGDQTRGRYVI
ncbi:MAG: cell division ATP-binding protein FtsE [Patescibacteria group bacterium]|nr:cell division ATP-binding protein FtsE [Patescibacteria group bacterium]MDD5164027.1 cell division ATP-binding protein FtsE [Patescibacteria group bacterium]MDD5534889.1 cell division ATP-binding protein FtsE [Patescibacteria group bacterium]